MTRQPVGDFETQMAFNQNSLFENLHKSQVSALRYQKNDLIPLRKSKQQAKAFLLRLFHLSVGEAYENVFIKDLKILISNLKQQVSEPVFFKLERLSKFLQIFVGNIQ